MVARMAATAGVADHVEVLQHRTRRALWPAALVGIAASAGAFALLFLPGDALDAIISEDSWVEWAGSIGLFVAAGAAAACALRARRTGRHTLLQLAFAALALYFFVAGGEEISWGQRILGISTPDEIAEANSQGELTAHNLKAVGKAPEIIFFASWIVVAVAIPAAVIADRRLAGLLRRIVPVVPIAFGAVFIGVFVLDKIAVELASGWDGYDSKYPVVHASTEIKEACYELAFAATMLWCLRRRDDPIPD
jgi:hypothetical protein